MPSTQPLAPQLPRLFIVLQVAPALFTSLPVPLRTPASASHLLSAQCKGPLDHVSHSLPLSRLIMLSFNRHKHQQCSICLRETTTHVPLSVSDFLPF
ncbi:hypothetical protein B0H13DRAFT_1986285 [Mycena leptocephala]|nr:hypothetical protein B0H13DRAFT_1986285 [Mycena leptocephala]